METIKQTIVDDRDSDNEEIFFGPITKREVMVKLKHNNLCCDELLEPLQKYQNNDVLDDSVIKFYYEDVKGNSNDENSRTTFTEYAADVTNDQNIVDLFNNVESTALTEEQCKDELDHSNRKSLTESHLLKKYVPSETHQSSSIAKDISVLEHGALNKSEQSYHDSLNIQYLSLDDQVSISINSTPENSPSVSLNSTPEKSKSDKCETVSLNSTLENPISPQSESFSSLTSTAEKSSINDNSGFNCTLDEMEMLMKFGENYMNESIDRSSIKIVGETESEKENYSPVAQRNQVQTPSTEKIKEHNKLIPRHTPKQQYFDYESPSPFKLPTRTIFKKSPASGYRNIVSPVAMYIKSAPKVPLVQNVSKKTVYASTFREIHNSAENCVASPGPGATIQLPARSYRPAARAIMLSREPEPALPGSLRRLIRGPLLPEVIRHVGRVATVPDTCELVTPVTPPAQDLTMLSSSLAQGDVSVYISTNAARTIRLQHNTNENSPFQ